MKDQISETRIGNLHPKVRQIFTSFIEDAEKEFGITLRVSEGYRSIAYQNSLYEKGRTQSGKIVTNAKGGSSYHNYGLAIDLVELKDGKVNWNFDYSKLLPLARKYNIAWGGLFKNILDKPHYEITFGYNWRDLLRKYNAKDFIPNTEFVNI